MKAIDYKAINWFCSNYNLKPQLSIPPMQMNFTDRETGLDKTVHLDTIILQYKEWNEADKKQRAAARKAAKKQEEANK